MPRGSKGQKGKGTGKGKGKGKGDGKSGDFGAAPMQMGYFGAWDGSHADSWSGWDGFAGNMGLLTAHEKPVEAVCASAMSDDGFKKAKAKRTFRPCKDFDLQLHAAMRRPLTINAFSALQTNDGEDVESPNLTRQVWNPSRPVATRYMAGRPLIQKARPAKL